MKILISLFSIFILIGANSCFETCDEATIRIDRPTDFHGIIDSIFLNEKYKNQPCVSIMGCEYLIYNSIYEQFSIGDTLFKNSGSMKYYWIKNGDTTIFYQKCGTRDIDEVRD